MIVRQCLVTPLSKLYYSVQGEDIIILSLEDARINPHSINKKSITESMRSSALGDIMRLY